MTPDRKPFDIVPTNIPLLGHYSTQQQLYPIFTKKNPSSSTHPQPSSSYSSPTRDVSRPFSAGSSSVLCFDKRDGKRTYSIKRLPSYNLSIDDCEDNQISGSIPDYIPQNSPQSIESMAKIGKATAMRDFNQPPFHSNVWRRPRKRFGRTASYQPCCCPKNSGGFLTSLRSRIYPSPCLPPSSILLPSLNDSTGNDRDFNPALALSFNMRAKMYTSDEAMHLGTKRLLAIGGEEGGVRIVNVDEPLGIHPEATGHWWRAHSNAVFEIKWTAKDTRLITASADQTVRLHDLSSECPKLLATLRGHTSTIKSVTSLDPQGSHGDGSMYSRIIASGGRDGNINIYDLRCQGRSQGFEVNEETASERRSKRKRHSAGVPGSSASASVDGHIVDPVLMVRQPHNTHPNRQSRMSKRSVSRTITSLVALQSMPGILASGGSFDGIVRLWDIRYTDGTSTCHQYGELPDPTISKDNPSRRARSVNTLCEQPDTGDLYALCGDSKVHVLRPSAAKVGLGELSDAMLPQQYIHPELLALSFYVRMSISPDGRYLACGSRHSGVAMWDTQGTGDSFQHIAAKRLLVPRQPNWTETPEVIAVDWAKDMLAASSEDDITRLWRSNADMLDCDEAAARTDQGEWSGIA